MTLIEIENKPFAVLFKFNSFASAFDAKELVVTKDSTRFYLSPDESFIDVIFFDGVKFELKEGSFAYFQNPNTGQPFASMRILYDELKTYLYTRS